MEEVLKLCGFGTQIDIEFLSSDLLAAFFHHDRVVYDFFGGYPIPDYYLYNAHEAKMWWMFYYDQFDPMYISSPLH